jgi:hypothetical protein
MELASLLPPWFSMKCKGAFAQFYHAYFMVENYFIN